MKAAKKNKGFKILEFLRQYQLHGEEEEFKKMVLEGYHNPDFLELRSCGDDYHGKVVYHIGAYGCEVGFFAEFIFLLMRLYFAEDRGFLPYVYWGDDFLYYEAGEREQNAFLHYFCPVSEVTSSENAAHVIMATHYHIMDVQKRLNTHGYIVSEEYMDACSSMIKKYIRYNEKTQAYLEKGYEQLIGDKKALAVHFRGTDYRRQYNNHPVFVTIEEEIEKARELYNAKGYETIFLATDEQEAVEAFRKEFGDIVKVF